MDKKLTIPACKNFTGYKPCHSDHNCWEDGCKDNVPFGTKILIINLDATVFTAIRAIIIGVAFLVLSFIFGSWKLKENKKIKAGDKLVVIAGLLELNRVEIRVA